MSDLNLVPISQADQGLLSELMNEEERAWLAELDWDYSPIRQILASFARQKLLPGYMASVRNRSVGYTYFLIHHHKGIIGTIYVSRPDTSSETADEILTLAIDCLKGADNIRRIEAQIMPFHNLSLTAAFTRQGFAYYPRYYLGLDLASYFPRKPSTIDAIVPWNPAFLPTAAEVTLHSYRNQADALLCEDYCTLPGCKGYLQSLVENPGCGQFLPEASFAGVDRRGIPCGFIISSSISSFAGMIPQIAIHPAHQGRGMGNALMQSALSSFKTMGYRSVSLTVTKKNRRAFEWYQRVGFRLRKEFGAYIWERQ